MGLQRFPRSHQEGVQIAGVTVVTSCEAFCGKRMGAELVVSRGAITRILAHGARLPGPDHATTCLTLLVVPLQRHQKGESVTLRLQSLVPKSKAQDLVQLTARLQPISQLRWRAALLQGRVPSFVVPKRERCSIHTNRAASTRIRCFLICSVRVCLRCARALHKLCGTATQSARHNN